MLKIFSPSENLQSRTLGKLIIAELFIQMVLCSNMTCYTSASTLLSCSCYLIPEAQGFHLRYDFN